MGAAVFKYTGALDPQHHHHLYVERAEDQLVRKVLKERVGMECVLISLIGARQTGKTSLLNRLHAQYNTAASGWTTIKFDLSILSEVEGEPWYQQFIATCCDRLQSRGIALSVPELQDHCASLYTSPFSARGWAELLRLACQKLPARYHLLVSLDEISSVPRQQWEPFFSNIRAIHQAASSSDDRPEYQKLGLILAGAFVPAQLINIVEKSPFNISTKVYMSLADVEKMGLLTHMLHDAGITLNAEASAAIHRWSGGLLYHIQRFCAEIAGTNNLPVTIETIDLLADKIGFDDAYLSHILRRLQETEILARRAQKIMQRPLRSDRNDNIIATLEITGVIRHDPATNIWKITNQLCERILQQHFVSVPEGVATVDQPPQEQVNAAALRQMLIAHFNDSELRDICFDLTIDYESLAGQGKADKARELIAYVRRYGRMNELVTLCRHLRPHADWQNLPSN